MRGLYINSNANPLTNFTSSSRSTEFKDIFPWNIFQMIAKTIPISTRIIISYAMKWGIPLTPSLDGWSTKAKEATWGNTGPAEVKLALLDTSPVFQCLEGGGEEWGMENWTIMYLYKVNVKKWIYINKQKQSVNFNKFWLEYLYWDCQFQYSYIRWVKKYLEWEYINRGWGSK